MIKMVLNNNISTRKFITRPNPKGTFEDIEPNFGIIKGLHLDYLEFPAKIKKNAPNISEVSYSGKLFEEPKQAPPPPPESGTSIISTVNRETPGKKASESTSSESKHKEEDPYSNSSTSSEDQDENSFLNKFGATPDKKTPYKEKQTPSSEESSKKKKIPKYIKVPEVPPTVVEEETPEEPVKVLSDEEQYIQNEIERRTLIVALRKAKALNNIDIGDIPDDMDISSARILNETVKKQLSLESSISMNRIALVGLFLGIDQGCGFITDKMKGYFQYQMEIIKVYDSYLEAIGETNLTTMFQGLDPSLQLGGVISLTTAGFFLFQNYIGEDKVKGAKLIQSLFPGNSRIIEEMTEASKKVKENKARESHAKKKRGPTFSAVDVNKMEG